jgi:hypothetical protein
MYIYLELVQHQGCQVRKLAIHSDSSDLLTVANSEICGLYQALTLPGNFPVEVELKAFSTFCYFFQHVGAFVDAL